jgi:hypothetical protein
MRPAFTAGEVERVMADGNDLAGLTAALKARTTSAERDIQQARNEIKAVEKKIADLQSKRELLTKQMDDLRVRLRTAAAGPSSDDLQRRLQQHQKELEEAGKALTAEQAQLQVLRTARKEDAVQDGLTRDRGNFLVAVKALMGTVNDGAVRYMIASTMLRTCNEMGVSAASFRSLADQQTAAEILTQLEQVKEGAGEPERKQAIRFESILDLVDRISDADDEFNEIKDDQTAAKASLTGEGETLRKTIAELEAPEPPEQAKARRRRVIIFVVLGVVALLVAAAAALVQAGGELWPVIAVIAGIIGLVALAAGWRNTDAHRANRLVRARADLKDAETRTSELGGRMKQHVQQAADKIVRFKAELAALGSQPPDAPSIADDPFRPILDQAKSLDSDWRKAHPEVRKLAPAR